MGIISLDQPFARLASSNHVRTFRTLVLYFYFILYRRSRRPHSEALLHVHPARLRDDHHASVRNNARAPSRAYQRAYTPVVRLAFRISVVVDSPPPRRSRRLQPPQRDV